MSTQWHPLFAHLMGLLLDRYYEIQTEVPVSDLPRKADLLVLRRQPGPEPPFDGLWSHLTDWNILEFKGPSDSAHDDDLERLVHVGTGLTYKLNEERRAGGQERLTTRQVSLWYLAPRLGDTFLGQARLRAFFEYDTGGVWGGRVWGHPIWLVSCDETRIEPDTIPLHLLEPNTAEQEQLVQLLVGHESLLQQFAKVVYTLHPLLWKEIRTMATQQVSGPKIDWEKVGEYADLMEVVDCLSVDRVIERMGVARAIEAIGLQRVIATYGIDRMLAELTPEQHQQLIQKLQPPS